MTRTADASGIARLLPVLAWLPSYRREHLSGDLVAGVTATAVMIPPQTAVNDGTGARSQLAGALTAGFVVLTLQQHRAGSW